MSQAGSRGGPRPRSQTEPAAQAAVALAIGIAGYCWMFRRWLFADFDGIFGDTGDARIIIAILEHWHRVFDGSAADWRSVGSFFPVRGTLGFTDAYFLYGVIFALLRGLGLDPFNAYMGVISALAVCGYVGFLSLACRHFGASLPIAAVGAFLFADANMMALKMGHPQSYCAMLLPFVVDLAATALRAASRRRAIVLAAAAGALHALIYFTAYLTGWFFALAVTMAATCYGLVARRAALEQLRALWRDRRYVPIAYLAGFGVAIVPFVLIYLPMVAAGYRYSYGDAMALGPRWIDILAWSRGNLVWGDALDRFPRWRGGPEALLGFTPLVLAVGFVYLAVLVRRWRRQQLANLDLIHLVLGLSIAALFLLQLKYFGVSPWWIVWQIVPGAKSVRTTFRIQVVLNLAAALLLTGALTELTRAFGSRRLAAAAAAGALALALMAEQWSSAPGSFSRRAELAWLSRVPPPPEGCAAFYLQPASPDPRTPWYADQSDAMLVSAMRGIPTVNGNASVRPRGWALDDIRSPDYRQALRDWIARHALGGRVCGLAAREGRWTMQNP